MIHEVIASIDSWYKETGINRLFQVVAIDTDNELIEVQYENGDIGEIEFNSWNELLPLPVAAPEDASAAFDNVGPDDLGYSDTDYHSPENLSLDDFLDSQDDF